MNNSKKIFSVLLIAGIMLLSTACGCEETDVASKASSNASSVVSSAVESKKAVSSQASSAKKESRVESQISENSVAPKQTSTASKSPTVTQPTYINGIMIVNKTYPLPADYNNGVDSTASAALDTMFSAAGKEGINLFVVSGFRSYDLQKSLYDSYVEADGKAAADRYSARPGHSEHQSGLAFDLNSVEDDFAYTAEGKWLAANCWKYGFIIRYPQNKESVTGYMYEPWHVRYVGKTVSEKMNSTGQCLEEYLNVTSVYKD